jgi:serine/threonine protein kinase
MRGSVATMGLICISLGHQDLTFIRQRTSVPVRRESVHSEHSSKHTSRVLRDPPDHQPLSRLFICWCGGSEELIPRCHSRTRVFGMRATFKKVLDSDCRSSTTSPYCISTLKPGNVLLTWDQGKLIPRAMLSDFGTSQDMLNSRTRSGNTGTLEYASPESLPSPQTGILAQMDSKSDIWSLGMILHKLLFFHLPYTYASGVDVGSACRGERQNGKTREGNSGIPGVRKIRLQRFASNDPPLGSSRRRSLR